MAEPNGPLLKSSDYEAAPDDDQSAFLYLEETARERMYAVYDEDNNGDRHYPLRSEYMTRVAGLAQTFGIPGISFDPDARQFDTEFWRFLSTVDYQTTQLSALKAKQRRRSSIRLETSAKEKISFHLRRVRDSLDNSNLSDHRRKILNRRLDDFESELAKPSSSLTPMIIFAALVLGTAADVSELSETFKSAALGILEQVGQARLEADEEEVRLIPPPPLQLSAPENLKKPKPQTSSSYDNLDDDIPF